MWPTDPTPSELASALTALVQILNERQTSYALIGGLGVGFRGPIRATRDIDLLVKIPQVDLPSVLEALRVGGFQIDVAKDIETWNRDRLLDFSFNTIRVDWLQPVLPAFEHVLQRARWETVNGQQIRVADAEGLLLLKLIAFRVRDQEDIKGILAANSGHLDLDWIRMEWRGLGGDGDPKTAQFEQLIQEFYVATKS